MFNFPRVSLFFALKNQRRLILFSWQARHCDFVRLFLDVIHTMTRDIFFRRSQIFVVFPECQIVVKEQCIKLFYVQRPASIRALGLNALSSPT